MNKEKTSNTGSQHELKIVSVEHDQAQIEFEIERYVKRIRSLISRLTPTDRQRYFDGLLTHLLTQPVDYPLEPVAPAKITNGDPDYSALTVTELNLIRELSGKIEYLYRTMDGDPV